MSVQTLKILLADDHKIVRIGLKALLRDEPNLEVAGEAQDGEEVLEWLKNNVADLVLMDIYMGKAGGITTTQQVIHDYPDVKVLALSQHEEPPLIIRMLEAGAGGYLLKNCSKEELVHAIRTVASGQPYFSQTVSAALLKVLTATKTTASKNGHSLSIRETEVLRYIACEFTSAQIAEKLFLSVRTVEGHRRNIMEKLQVKNTAGLMRYAAEKGLI
jgi:DNA-binding NarL/FixJ family response regulator